MTLDPRLSRRLLPIAVLAIVALATWWQQRHGASPGEAAGPAAPAEVGAAPSEPFPGGSLEAHEAAGGHTLDRHVGKSAADLRERMRGEGKREVSSFPDVATAERAIGDVLRRRGAEVAAWLEGAPQGAQEFSARLDAPVGQVLRSRDGGPRPGRTVVVVLAPSRRFPEGFRIVTAYVRLP